MRKVFAPFLLYKEVKILAFGYFSWYNKTV